MRREFLVRGCDGLVEGDFGGRAGLYDNGAGGVGEDTIAVRGPCKHVFGVAEMVGCLLAGGGIAKGLEGRGVEGLLDHCEDVWRERWYVLEMEVMCLWGMCGVIGEVSG